MSLARWFVGCVLVVALMLVPSVMAGESAPAADGVLRNRLLPPSADNPRNSEGDFIQLKDGRILFVYTHFTGGAGDHAAAYLAGRYSSDGGKTWSEDDVTIVPNEGGMNVMSVSLLRLDDGSIALVYLRKNSTSDCRPLLRISTDEAKTWSEPRECITDEVAYYVMNNDRVVQLASGRLLMPLSLHKGADGEFASRSKALAYYSDDRGRTWQRSQTLLELTQAPDSKRGLQEPGVIELKDHSLLMYCRTDQGRQFFSRSKDGGETWSPVEESPLMSPTSPASMKRIPKTGDILVVWNDHSDFPKDLNPELRTPLRAAISKDEGRTWQPAKTLESDPTGWYCYTAIEFVGDRVLLGHCAGQRNREGTRTFGGLDLTQITLFDVDWLYK